MKVETPASHRNDPGPSKPKRGISYEEAHRLLVYNPETGEFRWKISRPKCNKGELAGGYWVRNYLGIRLNGFKYMSHRLAWLMVYGEFPRHEVDHINGVCDDNRLCNLRAVTRAENNRNAALRKDNKTGIPGVRRIKDKDRWLAYIRINKKGIHLLRTNDFFEACCARRAAENKYGFYPNHGRR